MGTRLWNVTVMYSGLDELIEREVIAETPEQAGGMVAREELEDGSKAFWVKVEPVECFLAKTSLARGYVSVKERRGVAERYKGRYGDGYTVKKNNPQSTNYCILEYWVKEDKGDE